MMTRSPDPAGDELVDGGSTCRAELPPAELRAELPPAALVACDYHPGPTAEDDAEHAEQIRAAARSRNAARRPLSPFLATARSRRVARRDARLERDGGRGGSDG